MSADPWPLAVLLYTVSAPNKRQEPGWVNPPTLVWSPDQEEHLRAAWQGDAIRATDVPDLHARPITHARPAATLAVAQRGQQNPQWVVCMFSLADAHIVVCDPERLPGPEAVIRVADCTRMIIKALREGEHHALLLQVRLKDNARAAGPGVWPAAAHLADLELQLAVPTAVYHWLEAFHDLRWKGQARPPNRLHALANVAASRRAARCHPGYRARARDTSPRCGGPGPHTGATHSATGQPALRTSGGGRHSEVGAAPPWREGPRSRRNAPCVRTSTTQAGQCWNTWRGTRCTLRPRRTTRRRPPTSCRGEHGGPHGTPRTPGAPRPRQPTTQTEMRRHPERPREPAVRPHQGPCPSPLAPLAPPVPRAPLWAPLGTGSADAAHPDALAAPANPAAMPMRDS